MIKVTHAGDGFSSGIKAVVIDGDRIASVDEKGKEGKCTWDAEWLIRQAVSKNTDLRFEFTPKNN